MIRKENLEATLKAIGYIQSTRTNVFEKKYAQFDCTIEVDFNGNGSINYPEEKGMKITRKTTCNFSQPENFVVLECITRLMDKGYRPEHIELEKEWTLGHSDKGGFADILVKDADGKTLFIIECKTSGTEYKKELNNTLNDGGQLFSYWKQEGYCKWLSLYASDFDGTSVSYTTETSIVGMGVPNLHLNVIQKTMIVLPDITEQLEFTSFVRGKLADKQSAILQKKELEDERKSYLLSNF